MVPFATILLKPEQIEDIINHYRILPYGHWTNETSSTLFVVLFVVDCISGFEQDFCLIN